MLLSSKRAQVSLESPVSPALYPVLSVTLSAGGLVAAAALYVYAWPRRGNARTHAC